MKSIAKHIPGWIPAVAAGVVAVEFILFLVKWGPSYAATVVVGMWPVAISVAFAAVAIGFSLARQLARRTTPRWGEALGISIAAAFASAMLWYIEIFASGCC